MLIAVFVVSLLSLLVAIADLVIDLRALPRKRGDVKLQAADAGIALAERMGRLQRSTDGKKLMTSGDKVQMAVSFAVGFCEDLGVRTTAAEMRMLIEVRLELAQPKP